MSHKMKFGQVCLKHEWSFSVTENAPAIWYPDASNEAMVAAQVYLALGCSYLRDLHALSPM